MPVTQVRTPLRSAGIIRLHFEEGASFPFGAIEHVVHEVENILLNLERAELIRIREVIPEISQETVDDAIRELESSEVKAQVTRVFALKDGSLEVGVAMTAIGLWVLEKTLGKTIEETWKESELHKKIKAFFLTALGKKPQKIVDAINDREKPPYRKFREVDRDIPMIAVASPERVSIGVFYQNRNIQRDLIPTYSELVELNKSIQSSVVKKTVIRRRRKN